MSGAKGAKNDTGMWKTEKHDADRIKNNNRCCKEKAHMHTAEGWAG